MSAVGDLIRREREDRGLSQREAAAQIGVSPQYLCDVEKGRRLATTDDSVALLAGLFGYHEGDGDALWYAAGRWPPDCRGADEATFRRAMKAFRGVLGDGA